MKCIDTLRRWFETPSARMTRFLEEHPFPDELTRGEKQMAEFTMVMKELDRMCGSADSCEECSIFKGTGQFADCLRTIGEQPEEAEKIIMQWAVEHPQKTRLQKFRELFPNAPRRDKGNPGVCVKSLGWVDIEYNCECATCVECWNRPYEEPEGAGEK